MDVYSRPHIYTIELDLDNNIIVQSMMYTYPLSLCSLTHRTHLLASETGNKCSLCRNVRNHN